MDSLYEWFSRIYAPVELYVPRIPLYLFYFIFHVRVMIRRIKTEIAYK